MFVRQEIFYGWSCVCVYRYNTWNLSLKCCTIEFNDPGCEFLGDLTVVLVYRKFLYFSNALKMFSIKNWFDFIRTRWRREDACAGSAWEVTVRRAVFTSMMKWSASLNLDYEAWIALTLQDSKNLWREEYINFPCLSLPTVAAVLGKNVTIANIIWETESFT